MRRLIYLIFFLTTACQQEEPAVKKDDFELGKEISYIKAIEDIDEKKRAIEVLWEQLKTEKQIPFIDEDTAYFIIKRELQSFAVSGDFNAWGNDRSFNNSGQNIEGTNFWYLKTTFPSNARLDYKLVLNGSNWILDSNNPHQQWSGFGPNSVLIMPEWQDNQSIYAQEGVEKGTLSEKVISSNLLKYDLRYWIYQSASIENEEEVALAVITDGQEYQDDRLGACINVLDNLISSKKIKPLLVVFIDPRNPLNSNENRRMEEYTINENYSNFVIEELIPHLSQTYTISSQPLDRMILGTSLGGLNSAYFSTSSSAYFGAIAVQSPAFWFRPAIFSLVENANLQHTKWYISAGNFNDGMQEARRMQRILGSKNIPLKFNEVNEGHSWGAWSRQLEDIFTYFYGVN